jgi:flagellar biosynthesis protein
MADPSSRKKAVAIRYQAGDDPAPVVVAKGTGAIAEKILALAQEHQVPIYEDPDLLELLATLDLGQVIPPDLYQAVAEVLAFVYQMNQKYTP